MIINFSLQNFGSVKDKQTLTFEADKSKHLNDYYIVNTNGFRLLKLALIYGANASGKTTILNGLEFLRDLVLEPEEKKTDELEFNPFLFDEQTPNQTSILSINFLQNGIRYDYEVEFTEQAIVSEKLDNYNPKKANVFTRKTDLKHQFSEIKFGSKIKQDKTFKKTLESNTLWNNTVLGGYLKTNIDFIELNETVDWFSNYLKPLVYTKTKLEGFVTSIIENKEIQKKDVISILKKADFHISDILIQEEDEELPEGFFDFVEKLEISNDRVNKLKEEGKITSVSIDFEHTVNGKKYSLPIDLESQGTRRYYGFAGLLALLIKNNNIIPIDELESSLHPDLYIQFILSFLVNSQDSQILATTHNREILDNKDLFRNDAIWFTNKSENCSTQLYSLADFDTSVVRDTTNVLNAYKSGKLKGKPNLGDYYIDLD
ncbi:ATP-binding protein [Tenacibaculum litoreum]|uniref:AAA family ATPase n=1 Tax=Tenacibaculum litoreum TaxID=321269 RepID=UPI00389543D0